MAKIKKNPLAPHSGARGFQSYNEPFSGLDLVGYLIQIPEPSLSLSV